jgi:hypothetical protein
MTKRNNYNYQYPVGDEKIIKKLSDPKYKGGNIALPKDADEIEKIKYSICQSILTYHQEKNLFCPLFGLRGKYSANFIRRFSSFFKKAREFTN